jgi:hypothetical protein
MIISRKTEHPKKPKANIKRRKFVVRNILLNLIKQKSINPAYTATTIAWEMFR